MIPEYSDPMIFCDVDSTSLQTANLRQYCETGDPVTAALSEHNL